MTDTPELANSPSAAATAGRATLEELEEAATRQRQRHTKVRTGCQTCKARKVKCGEERPACRNCLRRGRICSYLAAAPARPPPGETQNLCIHAGEPSLGLAYSLLDLELLHHFTVSTSTTLSGEPVMRNFWRVTIPQIGFQHPYVLKSALSIAALHLARLQRVKRRLDRDHSPRIQQPPPAADRDESFYTEQALLYHNAASEAVRQDMQHFSDDNHGALLTFSLLTIYFALARPKEPTNLLVVEDGVIPSWLALFRGMRSLRRHQEAEVPWEDGPRSPAATTPESGASARPAAGAPRPSMPPVPSVPTSGAATPASGAAPLPSSSTPTPAAAAALGSTSSFFTIIFQSGIRTNEDWEAAGRSIEAAASGRGDGAGEGGMGMGAPFAELDNLMANITNMANNGHLRRAAPDPGRLDTLACAVDTLRRSYVLVYGVGHSEEAKLRAVFIWLFRISDEYVGLLQNGDDAALCILAFVCVLLKRLDAHWWMEGWGEHLLERIYARLQPGYRLWIQWPIEEIGWVA